MGQNSTDVTRRWALAGLLAGAIVPPVAGTARADAPRVSPVPPPRPAAQGVAVRKPRAVPADDLIAAAQLGGSVGFVVADTKTGLVLEARQGTQPLPPASVAKVITALYALDRLGPAHRFDTRLVASGPVRNGVIQGDLMLLGSGDPTLSTDRLADLAAALRARGITGPTGAFLVNGGALPFLHSIDPGQPDHVGYNPAVSGLNLNHNRVHFEWTRTAAGYAVSVDARSDRFRPPVSMATVQVVAREAPVFTYADVDGVDAWTVARAALGKSGSRWLPVRRPALYAGEVFRELARGQGVRLGAPQDTRAGASGEVAAGLVSEDLRSILRDMLRYSTNLTAEVAGLAASTASGGPVATLAASAARMNDWARATYGLQSMRLVDHSGLGAGSAVTPGDLVRALVAAAPAGALRPILRDIRMQDAQGNLSTAHPVKVAAKTGTLNFVSALAGYAAMPGNTDLAFAILTADTARRDRIAPDQREDAPGAADWTRRARRLHQQLIERWAAVYAG